MSREWTPEQKELIAIGPDGLPLLKRVSVSADAGSGKTSTLVERVKQYVDAADDQAKPRILCVSFTEKSAADLEQRLSAFESCEVYTIHGYCARLVQEFGARLGLPPIFRVLDAEEEKTFFYECFESVFKRRPISTDLHGPDTYYKLCQAFKDKGARIGGVPIFDSRGKSEELTSFAAEVFEEFSSLKKSMKALEYSDLEIFAAEILKSSEVAQLLQKRYQHVFIDEFQDTSEIQCEIATRLSGTRGLLFVVGDEKQSIYRFRGADVAVFRRFVKTLPENRRLSRNYRSDPKVIEAVNKVCAPILSEYQDMTAGKSIQKEDDGFKAVRVLCEDDAEGISAVIEHLKAHDVDPSKVVLLLRKVSNNKILRGLARLGVSVVSMGSGLAASDPAFASLINLWIWACEPWKRARGAKVLLDYCENADVTREKLFEEIQSFKLDYSGAETCERLLEILNSKFDLENRFALAFEEFSLFVLSHQAKGMLPAELAVRLGELLRSQSRISELTATPPPPELQGALRVMTVHASKGLEFPYVILADLNPRKPARGAILPETDKIWFCDTRDEKGDLDKYAQFDEASTRENGLESDESARLLYVAMTRAENGLFVIDRPVPAESKKAKTQAATWEYWLKSIAQTVSAEALVSKTKSEVASLQKEFEIMKPLSSVPVKYRPARMGVTVLAKGAHLPKAQVTAPVERAERKINYRQVGTDVHLLLQNEDWKALSSKISDTKLAGFFKWLETEQGKDAFDRKRSQKTLCEFAFDWKTKTAELGEVVVAGRIDRLVEFKDGSCWIIDYKVLFSKKSVEDFKAEYREQMKVYRDALAALTEKPVRTFLLDVTAATGSVFHEI